MASTSKDEIKYLESKLKKNPHSILFARLATHYLERDRVEEAIELCENGLKKHPFYVTGHMILGKCYLKKKLFDLAEKEFKRVLLFDPKYVAAHREYADLMMQIGWENTSEMSYKKILEIDPLNEEAREVVERLRQKRETKELNETEASEISSQETDEELQLGEIEEESIAEEESPTYEAEKDLVEEDLEQVEKRIEGVEEWEEKELPSEKVENDEEKFSSILEDIFRDDVATEETPQPESDTVEAFDLEDSETESQESLEEEEQSLEDQVIESELETKEEFEELPPESDSELEAMASAGDDEEVVVEEEQEAKKTNEQKEKIVTPTLGEIYAAQGQYAKAIGVYEILKKKEPENETYEQKIELLKRKLEESRMAG